jgi:Tol biopolymer transport system component
MLRHIAFILMLALWTSTATASTVRATKGNLYYFGDDGVAKQLTSFGTDSEPSLSPDGKTIVFVRLRSITFDGPDRQMATELWKIESTGQNPKLLLKPRSSQKPEH